MRLLNWRGLKEILASEMKEISLQQMKDSVEIYLKKFPTFQAKEILLLQLLELMFLTEIQASRPWLRQDLSACI